MENNMELLQLQTNAKENQNNLNSNTELIHREKIENTPFEIIGNEERGYFIALGRFRLTEPVQSIDECKHQLTENQWEIITTMIITLTENIIKYNEQEIVKTENS